MTESNVNVTDHPVFREKHPGYMVFEKVMITLAVFTLIELLVSEMIHGGFFGISLPYELGVIILLVLAFIKALLVAGYFMHIFYEKKPLLIFIISFVFPIFLGLPIVLVPLLG